MEVVLPIVAIGGMYILSNRRNNRNNDDEPIEEGLENLGTGTTVNEINFIKSELDKNYDKLDETNIYRNPNQSTDKFFKGIIDSSHSADQYYIQAMTGENMKFDDFKHNNMQPFLELN